MPSKAAVKTHGGRRAGAGRKPTDGVGVQILSITLTPKHIKKVEKWEDDHGTESFSEAMRQIIDTV